MSEQTSEGQTTKKGEAESTQTDSPRRSGGKFSGSTKEEKLAKSTGDERPAITETDVRRIVTEALGNPPKDFWDSFEKKVRGIVVNASSGPFDQLKKKLNEILRMFEDSAGDLDKQAKARVDDLKESLASVRDSVNGIANYLESDNGDEAANDESGADLESAAGTLATLSRSLNVLSNGVVDFIDRSEGIAKQLEDTPNQLEQLSSSIENSSSRLKSFVDDLSDPEGRIGQFANNVNRLGERIEQSLSGVDEAVKQAEGTLSAKQDDLEKLISRLSDGIDAPRMIRDEVVPKLGSFFDNVAASVKGLSDRLEGLKEQMDRVGDVSKFQEKALLAIRFGEVCKRLQKEFEDSLTHIDAPSASQSKDPD